MKRFLLMAALIGAVGILGACSKKHESAPPPPPKAAAPANSTMKMVPAKPMTAHPAMSSAAPQTKTMASKAMTAPKPSTGGG